MRGAAVDVDTGTMRLGYHLCSIQTTASVETPHSIDMVIQHCHPKSAAQNADQDYVINPKGISMCPKQKH